MNTFRVLFFLLVLLCIQLLIGQEILEPIVTWDTGNGTEFKYENINRSGSDLNRDGYDAYVELEESISANSVGRFICNVPDINGDGQDEILINDGNGEGGSESTATIYGLAENTNSECKIENYPNPFNPSTMVTFFLPEESYVKLEIYNLKGQLVKELIDEEMSAGKHTIEWDGHDAASGIYLARLISGKQEIISKKMLLLK
jgi:hypothetical protein